MCARGREGADIEEPVQRLLLPQRVAVGQGVRLAPLPLRGIGTQRGLEVGDAGLPGSLDRIGAGFLAGGIAVVPPGRIRRRRQARQCGIDHTGREHRFEEVIAQFIVHRRLGQVKQQLVEQGGAGGVERVVALPLGQLLHQLELCRIADHFAQRR
ncbi:hypothetical protein D3C73_1210930 [compost metagenome]